MYICINKLYATKVLIDFVFRSLDRKHFLSTHFLDLEKAFDTVGHTLLFKN